MILSQMANIWVVVPAYNEAEVIGNVVRYVSSVYPAVVVVDDCSKDTTGAQAADAGAIVLRHAVNLGQGAALQTGISYALAQGARHVYTFDADGQHAPESLLILADVLERTRAQVVLGSRTLGKAIGIPKSRKVVLKAALAFTRFHASMP